MLWVLVRVCFGDAAPPAESDSSGDTHGSAQGGCTLTTPIFVCLIACVLACVRVRLRMSAGPSYRAQTDSSGRRDAELFEGSSRGRIPVCTCSHGDLGCSEGVFVCSSSGCSLVDVFTRMCEEYDGAQGWISSDAIEKEEDTLRACMR